ncbi:MAG: acetylxylan esterase [Planctomycetes bacterium]|nr:acetylxylan esterase [Planctomycetota bacterium]
MTFALFALLVPLVAAPARIRVETEDMEGAWRLQTNIGGYSGGGFRVSNARGVATDGLRASLDIPHAGRWIVWARGYEGGGGDRRFRVAVAGKALPPTHAGRTQQAFSWQRAGEVELAAGETTLEVLDAGDSYECPDAVILTEDPAYDPDAARRALAFPEGSRPEDLGERNNRRLIEETGRDRPPIEEVAASSYAWEKRRAALAPFVREALGLAPPPEKTPLAARTAGVLERDGYRLEKVVFESRRDFPVTANLYLPERIARPAPTVLCPIGHWGLSKAEPRIQARAITLARMGFVALVYDPLGQGERAVAGNGHDTAFLAWLAGESNMTYMIWDSIRAIDYLATRPEVDTARLGSTGCSGGGLNTLYLEAVEERLRATVPVGYVVTFRSFFETGISHCPCSHVPGLGRSTDMPEIAALAAPRAQLLVGGERDPMFTGDGMRDAFAQILRIYGALGVPERADLLIVDAEHDYNQPMRERMYGFFARHLAGIGDGSAIPEPPFTPEPRESLFCFPEGRVPASSKTYRDLVIERIRALEIPRPAQETRAIVARLIRAAPGDLRARDVPGDGALRRLVFTASDGYESRGILAEPADADGAVVYVTGAAIEDTACDEALAAARPPRAAALFIEPRLWDARSGGGHVAWTNGVLNGEPAAAGWARDLSEAGRWMRGKHDRVALVARGPAAAVAAIVALAGYPGTFDACAIEGAPRSWTDLAAPPPVVAGAFLPGIAKAGAPASLLDAARIPTLILEGALDRAKLAAFLDASAKEP